MPVSVAYRIENSLKSPCWRSLRRARNSSSRPLFGHLLRAGGEGQGERQGGQRDDEGAEGCRRVLITAVVCSRVGSETLRCHIVDASKSGCRLESDRLET